MGFRRAAGSVFDAGRVERFFADLARGAFGPRSWRAKGVFRCAGGWRLFNLSDSGVDVADARDAGESRCDIILENPTPETRARMDAALAACVVSEREGGAHD